MVLFIDSFYVNCLVENQVPECLLTTNCKTLKHVGNKKSLFLVITSLTFLISGAIYSQLSVLPVFAASPAYCFENQCPGRFCSNNTAAGTASCCWEIPLTPHIIKCQTCHVNTDTGEFENCTDVSSKGKPSAGIIAPPPSGVAPPPPPGPGQGGPGNVLPEGVFEGPTTPPRQQKMTPEIAPLPPTCPPGQVLDENTNLCFRVPQEQEEQQQQSEVTEEEQPVPVCQEGLEFNENLGLCVPTECPEGQELNEQTGLCVLEEQPAADQEPEEQQQTEEVQQQPDEGQLSEDNSDNGE
jgi:hypothetical protein